MTQLIAVTAMVDETVAATRMATALVMAMAMVRQQRQQ
jgi:hypothetical protein